MTAISLDVTFNRALLRELMPDVRRHTTAAERKAAWVYKTGRQQWEFHGPAEFYWYGYADNAADARYKGWASYLCKVGIEGYTP